MMDLAAVYHELRIALVGDFCLDRYLEIDAARQEVSLETGLAVHNVARVRSQPGAAGTILNNLVALGVGEIHCVGFCGDDGEGFELQRALAAMRGVRLDHFVVTRERRTFTYCKPLVIHSDRPPEELNRLDSKNWMPTPPGVQDTLARSIEILSERVDAMILLDQVDVPETGVITRRLLDVVGEITSRRPTLHVVADSRRGLSDFPSVTFKMNRRELEKFSGATSTGDIADVSRAAEKLAARNCRPVFVTLAEAGIVGAVPGRPAEHAPALPIRGEIDIVGAGDAVTANLTCGLAAGLPLRDTLRLANAAASVVIHQLGTTGTATLSQIDDVLKMFPV
jgi:rfaE bifunctional protein kinase chain/domain